MTREKSGILNDNMVVEQGEDKMSGKMGKIKKRLERILLKTN